MRQQGNQRFHHKEKGSSIPGGRENVWNGEPSMLSNKEVDKNSLIFQVSTWEDSVSIPEVVKKLTLLKYT